MYYLISTRGYGRYHHLVRRKKLVWQFLRVTLTYVGYYKSCCFRDFWFKLFNPVVVDHKPEFKIWIYWLLPAMLLKMLSLIHMFAGHDAVFTFRKKTVSWAIGLIFVDINFLSLGDQQGHLKSKNPWPEKRCDRCY